MKGYRESGASLLPGQQGRSKYQPRQRALPPAGGGEEHCQDGSVVRGKIGNLEELMGEDTGCGQDRCGHT